MERASRNLQCCCYSEAQRGPGEQCNSIIYVKDSKAEGKNKLTIATRLSHHSICQDPLEWASESVSNPTKLSVYHASGISSACMGDCGQATLDL